MGRVFLNIIEYQCSSLNSLESQMNDALVKLSITDTAQAIVQSLERAFTGHLPLRPGSKNN